MEQIRQLTDFLIEQGIDNIEHTNKTYLAHLIAVYKYLEFMGYSLEVACGGMFHSIYGTERFRGFKLPLEDRTRVREVIGVRAEQLAYLNCAMDRATFDLALSGTAYCFKNRLVGKNVTVSKEDFDDLCAIHLYDWLEQVPRCKRWDYRRAEYKQIAQRLGSEAVAEYERVFAEE